MSLTNIMAPVSSEMKEFEKFFRSTVKTDIPLLDPITNHILRRKGKQLRPMLVLLSAKLTGKPNKSTFTAAAMIELLHTATLIHDDVVDDSYERRGFFSLYAIWKTKISVLVGDYLLSRGLLLAVENKEYRVLEIISQAVKEMSEGELYQIKKSRKLDITESEYFEIIRKKTATLMIACTAAGASSVNAPGNEVEMLRQYSAHAGIAFQIKDDLFDYQKKGITGKPAANDIKEKKLTLPLIHALSIAPGNEKRKIINLIRNNRNNSQKIDKIIDFVISKNGIEYATAIMEEHKVKAIESLISFPDNEAKKSLTDLAIYITERKN
ncbi:MAG: polyprenyl synthetase family protein [Marinilabiliales bacterium]|nr:MAG: polyprenyl synthetase family protein [Marinilabiliales bacterium]